MDVIEDTLQIHTLKAQSIADPMMQVLSRQIIAKILIPAEFDFGLRRQHLAKYTYAPGEMILCRRDTEEWVRWNSPVEMLTLTIPDHALRAVAEEAGGNMTTDLIGTDRLDDDRTRALVNAVEAERATGFMSGRLYIDSISQALAAVLFSTYGTLRHPFRQYRGGLSPMQLRRVTDYVYENLARDVSLSQMAEQAGLSTAYFSQMFRQSTSLPPHKFVLGARIDKAKQLLTNRTDSVLDIAMACGFQTQQHFARVFRAFCCMTPTQFRASRLG